MTYSGSLGRRNQGSRKINQATQFCDNVWERPTLSLKAETRLAAQSGLATVCHLLQVSQLQHWCNILTLLLESAQNKCFIQTQGIPRISCDWRCIKRHLLEHSQPGSHLFGYVYKHSPLGSRRKKAQWLTIPRVVYLETPACLLFTAPTGAAEAAPCESG